MMAKMEPSVQPVESKKAPIARRDIRAVRRPARARQADALARGSLWKRKMRHLALRRPKGRTRRDRSGAPMKRG